MLTRTALVGKQAEDVSGVPCCVVSVYSQVRLSEPLSNTSGLIHIWVTSQWTINFMTKRLPMNVNGYFCFTKTKQTQKTVVGIRATFLAGGLSPEPIYHSSTLPPATRGTTNQPRQANFRSFSNKHNSGMRGSMCKVFYLKFWKVKTSNHLPMRHSHQKEERKSGAVTHRTL